jgi:hypothetical protein
MVAGDKKFGVVSHVIVGGGGGGGGGVWGHFRPELRKLFVFFHPYRLHFVRYIFLDIQRHIILQID